MTRQEQFKDAKVKDHAMMVSCLPLVHLNISPEGLVGDDVTGGDGARLKDVAYLDG